MAANDPDAYFRSTLAVARFQPGRRLDRVRCPTLIIAGEADRVVPRVYQERLRKRLPHAQFVSIPDSGHASNIDHPDVVNEAVLRFLHTVDGRRRHSVGAQGRNHAWVCYEADRRLARRGMRRTAIQCRLATGAYEPPPVM